MALADLDGDGRLDVVQAQGEDPKAVEERVFFGVGLKPDTAPPSITMVSCRRRRAPDADFTVRARVHDRKSPSLDLRMEAVVVEWTICARRQSEPRTMKWYGEYLWRRRCRRPSPRHRLPGLRDGRRGQHAACGKRRPAKPHGISACGSRGGLNPRPTTARLERVTR